MMAWYRRWPFLSGVTLIVMTNVVALVNVINNRRGAPESTLTLTQRELTPPYNSWGTGENSGLALRLRWRTEQSQEGDGAGRSIWFGGEGDWLDAAKLAELGIQVRPRSPRNADSPSYSNSLPTDVLLVLEMNGAAYQRQLDRECRWAASARNEDAEQDCEREKHAASRLFIVDAGLDRDALRRKYPNATVHAIVHGQVEAARVPAGATSRLVGYVRGIATDEIHVPASMRAALGPGAVARFHARDQMSPFEASVAFGRRLEPWIVELLPEGEGFR